MTDNRKIYNLTTHFSNSDEVEKEPRLGLLKNSTDNVEAVDMFVEASKDIPFGASVLIAGHPSFIFIGYQLAKMYKWRVYFPNGDKVYGAPILSREKRFEIERKRNAHG